MHNIAFSQVREDPQIVINTIKRLSTTAPKILIVASGGCNLCNIVAGVENPDMQIDCIDANIDQLYLTDLRLAVVLLFPERKQILDFLEGRFHRMHYIETLKVLELQEIITPETYKYWNKNLELLEKGINKIGKYEQLFRQLVNSSMDFDNVFSNNNLIHTFGKEAVQQTTKLSFVKHFKNVFERYQKEFTTDSNYFYQQFVSDNYSTDLPLYLQHPERVKLIDLNKVMLINNDLFTHINISPDLSYDFIDVSNIPDWMPRVRIDKLFSEIYRTLKANGFMIARRLASDNDIKQIASEYFEVQDETSRDKSCFYNNVIVCRKL